MPSRRFISSALVIVGLTAACGGTVGLGSDAQSLKGGGGAADAGPAPGDSGPAAVDAGPAPDGSGPLDAGPAPDADGPGGSFACGASTCDGATEYCEVLTGGIPPPDGGAPGVVSSSCSPLPAACAGAATCACVEAAVGGGPVTCTESAGDVTLVREGI
jgi:hypothetical protein